MLNLFKLGLLCFSKIASGRASDVDRPKRYRFDDEPPATADEIDEMVSVVVDVMQWCRDYKADFGAILRDASNRIARETNE